MASRSSMQPVNFKSVEEFLDYLPPTERDLVQALRELCHQCLPLAREKLSYQVPFFSHQARICFIWPPSVPWGKTGAPKHVQLGFCQAHLMSNELGFLTMGTRKQVGIVEFNDLTPADADLVKAHLYEAWEIDQELGKTKRHKKAGLS